MSLRFRLNLIITALFLFALLLGVALVIQNTRRAVQDELQSTVNLTSQLLGEAIASLEASGNVSRELALIQRINRLENTRHLCIGIYDRAGKPAAQSSGCVKTEMAAAPAWFTNIVAPDSLALRRSLSAGGARPAKIVVTANPADEITEAWQEASDLLILMVGFWVAANIFVFITIGAAMRPIDTILRGLDGIERGDYKLRLPSFKLPEFARISASFNHMAGALQKSTAENRYLTQKSLDIQEQERRLMARELHDELGQCLSAVQADAVSISRWSQGTAPQVYESAQAIVSISTRVFEVIRGMIKQLRPATLDELGLALTLSQTIDDWNTRHPDQFCRFSARGDLDLNRIDEAVSIHIYRIVQECLTNIERHADAREISVAIESCARAGEIVLRVIDDGCGFDLGVARRGLGLLGMRERVKALEGTLEIKTAPGAGTQVEVHLPVQPAVDSAAVSSPAQHHRYIA